jgi:hypothetical protein
LSFLFLSLSYVRVSNSNRDVETTVTIDYLQRLHAAYEEFLTDISRIIPVIRVSWHEFRTAEEMAAMICREYASMLNMRRVSFSGDTDAPESLRKAREEAIKSAAAASSVPPLS